MIGCHTMEEEKRVPAAGILMALCCHHRCDWSSYTGKDFMLVCTVVIISLPLMGHDHLCYNTGTMIIMDIFNNHAC
jgi:hypothetical protein